MSFIRVKNLKNGNITEIPASFLALPNYQNAYELTDEHAECATCKMDEPEVIAEENVGEAENVPAPLGTYHELAEPVETETRKSRRKG